ncbi:MAG: hypothetical protein AAGB12_00530 [Pseudomonadota bacterium]
MDVLFFILLAGVIGSTLFAIKSETTLPKLLPIFTKCLSCIVVAASLALAVAYTLYYTLEMVNDSSSYYTLKQLMLVYCYFMIALGFAQLAQINARRGHAFF